MRSISTIFIAFAAAAACLGCRSGPDVVRLSNGRPIDGHFIEPSAYSAFLQGSLLEQNGSKAEAAKAYARAVTEDPRAAEAWARLGAMQCVRDPHAADTSFARAFHLGRHLTRVFLARAECELERGHLDRAVNSATRAAALAPNDVETSLVMARVLERAGRLEDAGRWLHGLSLREPGALAGLRATADFAARNGTLPHGRLAGERIEVLVASLGGRLSEEDARTAVDRALVASDLPQARASALRAHLSNADLAVRAYQLGKFVIALEVAARVLSVEPGNADARIVALAAADAVGDEDAVKQHEMQVAGDHTPPTEAAARIMERLLRRHAGEEAARTWSTATGL